MEADTIYLVRVWVHPDAVERMMGWLREKHLADVVSQPGFRFGHCIRLEQEAEDGWVALAMIYGLESRDALDRYFQNPIGARFAEERKAFDGMLRMDRAWGRTELTHHTQP